ncbi:MAG TPA: GNAT family N-acetyltransferase [Propionibacteriaceae bacterium]|nr:GNAT family N-acetyltransferase [Propionibacteriaceae bacterium]
MTVIELFTIPLDSDLSPTGRGWMEASRLAFNQSILDDAGAQRWWDALRTDNVRVRAARAATAEFGLDPEIPVGTFASFDAALNVGHGRKATTNAIMDVSVRTTSRRQGLLRTMMKADLDEAVARGVPFATLTASEAGIYGRFGFGVSTSEQVITLDTTRFGLRHTPGGRVEIAPSAALVDLRERLFHEVHRTRRGSHARTAFYPAMLSGAWDWEKSAPDPAIRAAVHISADGRPDGVLTYKVVDYSEVKVLDLLATGPDAEVGLWQFVASVDLTKKATYGAFQAGMALPWALTDRRAITVTKDHDVIWLRVLDVVAALEARGWDAEGEILLGVRDAMGYAEGTYRVSVSEGLASVGRTTDAPEAECDVDALGSAFHGLVGFSTLARAGRVDGSPEAVAKLNALFRVDEPPQSFSHF